MTKHGGDVKTFHEYFSRLMRVEKNHLPLESVYKSVYKPVAWD